MYLANRIRHEQRRDRETNEKGTKSGVLGSHCVGHSCSMHFKRREKLQQRSWGVATAKLLFDAGVRRELGSEYLSLTICIYISNAVQKVVEGTYWHVHHSLLIVGRRAGIRKSINEKRVTRSRLKVAGSRRSTVRAYILKLDLFLALGLLIARAKFT